VIRRLVSYPFGSGLSGLGRRKFHMKRFCLISLLLISVFFLFSVKTGNAALVDFDDRYYYADAWTEYDDSADNWGSTYAYDEQTSPPVSAEASFTRTDYSGYGLAYTNDGLNFYAGAEARNDLSDSSSYVYSSAYIEGYLYFTATTPALHVSFDYNVNVSAQTYGSDAYAYSYSDAKFTLYDYGSGSGGTYLADEYWWLDAGADPLAPSDSIIDGFFEGYFALTEGNYYELCLSPWDLKAEVYGNAHAYASSDFSNVKIEAVPLPSAVLLLGSGLIGLVALRRKSS